MSKHLELRSVIVLRSDSVKQPTKTSVGVVTGDETRQTIISEQVSQLDSCSDESQWVTSCVHSDH